MFTHSESNIQVLKIHQIQFQLAQIWKDNFWCPNTGYKIQDIYISDAA